MMVKYFLIIVGFGAVNCCAMDQYDNYLSGEDNKRLNTKIPNFHLIYKNDDGSKNNITSNANQLQKRQLILGNKAFLITDIQNSQRDFHLKRQNLVDQKFLGGDQDRPFFKNAQNTFDRNLDVNSTALLLQKSSKEIFYDQVKQGAYYLLQEILRNSFDSQDLLKVLKDLIKSTTEFGFAELNKSGKISDSVYEEIYKQLNVNDDFMQTFKDTSKCCAFFTNLGQKVGDQLVVTHQLNDTQRLLISTGFTTVGQIFGNIVPIVFRQTEAVEQRVSGVIDNLLARIMGCCVTDQNVVRD